MIYVLRFSKPIGDLSNRHGHAMYYLGWCEDNRFSQRLNEHRSGKGAAITRYAVSCGINLEVALIIEGASTEDEKRLKSWKSHKKVIKRFGGEI